jgi:tetratricopeptide (TPR) repeat protein
MDAEVPPVIEQLVKKGQNKQVGSVPEKWNDRKYNKWLTLRENIGIAKKEKNLQDIIEIGKSIIELDSQAKFIGIMVPIFEKEIAGAYLKQGKKTEATAFYQAALAGYKADQTISPGSWIKDVDRLEKQLAKLNSGT